MSHILTVAWKNNPPKQWWEAAVFTLENKTSTDLVDPLIEFTVDTNQNISENSGLSVSRPEGSNHVKGRLAPWMNTVKAHSQVEFSIGVSPKSGSDVGPLPRNLKVNGEGGEDPTRPTKPGNFRVTAATKDSLTVAWDPSTSPAGIKHYWLTWSKEPGEPGDTVVHGTTHQIAGLEQDTRYRLAVYAVDNANASSDIAATEGTTSGGDPEPPDGLFPPVAPFVDALAWPTPRLRKIDTQAGGLKGFFLGFLAPAKHDGRTRATWGGVPSTWDKYEPIADTQCKPGSQDGRTHSSIAADSDYLKWLLGPLQAKGRKIVISAGGASAHPIEEADDLTPDQAAAEYIAVLDNYNTIYLDFDIEGSALGRPEHQDKHVQVLAEIRRLRPDIRISHTLPVDRDGWNPTTKAIMRKIADSGYQPDLVMGMLMEMRGDEDYGEITLMSARAMIVHMREHFGWNEAQAWRRFGACPMFGQNINKRVFTQDHMRRLVVFAKEKGIAVVSGWDATRDYNQANPDRACEETPGCPTTVGEGALNTCTRVSQDHLEFSKIAATYGRRRHQPAPASNPIPSGSVQHETTFEPQWTAGGLNTGREYLFGAIAVSSSTGQQSEEATILVTPQGTKPVRPARRPRNLRAENISPTSATLAWSENTEPVDYYTVAVVGEEETRQQVIGTTVDLRDLTPATTYTLSVAAGRESAESTTTQVEFTTPLDGSPTAPNVPNPLPAVTGLTVTAPQPELVEVTWDDAADRGTWWLVSVGDGVWRPAFAPHVVLSVPTTDQRTVEVQALLDAGQGMHTRLSTVVSLGAVSAPPADEESEDGNEGDGEGQGDSDAAPPRPVEISEGDHY